VTNDQAVVRLRACRGLLARIDQSGRGIDYQLSEADLDTLQGFADVANAAAARPDGEGWLDDLCHHADLRPSSIGLLSGVLHTWYTSHISPEAQIEHLKRALAKKWNRPEPDE
jgi:hypothetical protein